MKILDDVKVLIGKDSLTPQKKGEPRQRILIVEDEKPIAQMLGDNLRENGYEVVSAANGEDGLQAAKEFNPDIILLDLLMPVMDGKTMLSKLRNIPQFKSTPVIILTNAGEVDNIRETVRYDDAVDFLIKSNVTLDEVVKKVKQIAW